MFASKTGTNIIDVSLGGWSGLGTHYSGKHIATPATPFLLGTGKKQGPQR